jgi:hypothetical protein
MEAKLNKFQLCCGTIKVALLGKLQKETLLNYIKYCFMVQNDGP